MTAKLPKKLWQLASVAMKDLAAVERSKAYRVDMATWHDPYTTDKGKAVCEVCLGGAVLAKTLKMSPNTFYVPSYFGWHLRLRAINNLRVGQVDEALMNVGGARSNKAREAAAYLSRDMPDYHSNKKRFKTAMRKLIRDLKAADL